MTDIATLSYSIDSSGLERGERALDDTTKAAENTSKAVEQLDDRFKGIARRAVEFAEANRVGNQSERSLAEAAREAAAGIDTKTQIMARSGTEAERMARRVEQMRAAEEKQAKAAEASARAAQLQELNLKKLVGQIDPTIAKLERLAQQESQLEKAFNAGAINPQVFEQYQQRIEMTRAATLNAGRANDSMTKSLGQLNLASVESQQSIAALGRALATGQWGQAQASITSLAARTGVMTAAFTAAAIPVGLLAAAIGGLAISYYQGWKESRELERAITGIGSTAGLTAGQVIELRNEIVRSSGSYREATEALTILITSGRNYGDTLDEMARASVNLANLTGQSISSATAEIKSLADGGSDALVKLNDKYGFLTLAMYKNIEAVREQRGDYSAAEEAIKDLDLVMADRAANMVETAGTVERAWKGVGKYLREVMNDLKDVGRSDIDAQIRTLTQDLQVAQNGMFGTRDNDTTKFIRGRLAVLGVQKSLQEQESAAAAERAQYQKDAIAAEEEARKQSESAGRAIETRIAGIDRESAKMSERNRIIEEFNRLSVRDPGNARLFDGSQERLIAAAEKRIDETFNRRNAAKPNANDNAANNFLKNIQRQIEANEQLTESGVAVSTSERLVIQARQLLSDSTNKMTGATRAALEAAIPMLDNTDKQAKATQQLNRDRAAQAALTERLANSEKARQEAVEIDLMSLYRGSDAVDQLRRQLEVEREYNRAIDQLNRQQRNAKTALSKEEYEIEVRLLDDSRQKMLDIERNYERSRLEIVGDWRRGAQGAMESYLQEGRDIAGQYNRAFTNAFQGMEDAFAQFATTGKLSFSDLARSIIADLGRIAAKQLVTGLVGNIFGGMFGGAMGATNAAGASSASLMSGSSFTLQGASNGGLANGGPTYAGMVNRVGENRPEMYTENGKQYLIPGNNGRVNPMAPARAGGMGSPVVNITLVGAPEGTTATASQNGQGGFDVEVMMGQIKKSVAGDIAQGGVVWNAMKNRGGLRDAV